MGDPAANHYRVERDTGTTPIGKRHKAARMIGTALTGLPMPSSRMKFDGALRIIDSADIIVYEQSGEQSTIDALELTILGDLMRLDIETFRAAYGLPDDE
jgi:hypothetical protein